MCVHTHSVSTNTTSTLFTTLLATQSLQSACMGDLMEEMYCSTRNSYIDISRIIALVWFNSLCFWLIHGWKNFISEEIWSKRYQTQVTACWFGLVFHGHSFVNFGSNLEGRVKEGVGRCPKSRRAAKNRGEWRRPCFVKVIAFRKSIKTQQLPPSTKINGTTKIMLCMISYLTHWHIFYAKQSFVKARNTIMTKCPRYNFLIITT